MKSSNPRPIQYKKKSNPPKERRLTTRRIKAADEDCAKPSPWHRFVRMWDNPSRQQQIKWHSQSSIVNNSGRPVTSIGGTDGLG
ncbi:hypothetical protein NPIL_434781 [Nephila pilipes]|uniref:Uncharacterized protein n=1 Tax=Nephila pilipes TaxID=299642 RepID=A0A8X6J508_NEPPI|nr:hypothetical protein NPIL_434781 [Nephila pilipes]